MKLYVVGAKTADPKEWNPAWEYSLVVAADESAARRIAQRDEETPITEIPMNSERVLVSVSDVF